MAYLTVEKGSNKGASHELPEEGVVVVGRSKKADFRFKDRFVSRTHFQIEVEDGTYRLEDLDSDNGTYVNGEAVEQTTLEDGDHLQIGETHLSFISEESHQEQADLIGETVGGHEILERIGRGGMGTVYKARQVSLDRIVALKILESELVEDEKFVEQFLSEARSAATLNHPNVAQVYDVGDDDGVYFLSMEYIRGGSLHDLLSECDILPPERAAEITQDIARALDFARRKELVHRDIKPGNIMLTEEGKAKLIDLGIAKQGMKEWEDEGVMVGTPDYMAPEQATDASVDTQADIYALGVTFYRMVTGERPIKGQSSDEVIQNKFEEDPIPPSSKNEDVPEWMSSLIMDMIQVDPDQRVTIPQQVVERIDQKGERKSLLTVNGMKRLAKKRIRPRRWPLFAGAAAVLVILLGITFYASQPTSDRPSHVANPSNGVDNEDEKEGGKSDNSKGKADSDPDGSNEDTDDDKNEQKPGDKRVKALKKLRSKVESTPSDENFQNALQAHQQFVKKFSKHPKQEQVKKHLNQLKKEHERFELAQKHAKIRDEYHSLQSAFRTLSPATLKQVKEAKQLLESGTKEVIGVNDLQSKLKRILATNSRETEKFRALNQQVEDWYKKKKQQLSTIRKTLNTVSQKLDQEQFKDVAELIETKRTEKVFQQEQFQPVLNELTKRFHKEERAFYHSQTDRIVDALMQEGYDRASDLISMTRSSVVSEALRGKLAQEKANIAHRKRQNKTRKRREKKKKERVEVFKSGVEQLVQIQARVVSPQDVLLNVNKNLEFDQNKGYLQIFQFLIRQYKNFFQMLGNRAATFGHNIIEDQELGQVEIIDASPTVAELDIPNVSATSNRSWNEFSISTLLGFVYQNKVELTGAERTTLATMYYLFDHKENVSRSDLQSLIDNKKLVSNEIPRTTARSIFQHKHKQFEQFLISTLIQEIHRLLSDGEGITAWRYCQFLQKRFRSHSSFRERKTEIQKLFEHTKELRTNPDTSRIETWSIYMRPHAEHFEEKHLPRIKELLMKLNFRLEYELRGRIQLYLGRYDDSFSTFEQMLPNNWMQKLKQGNLASTEHRATFYVNFYKSAVLAEKSKEIQNVLRTTAIQMTLSSDQKGTQERVNKLKNWKSNLKKKKEKLKEEKLSFTGGREEADRILRINKLLGPFQVPDLKLKFLVVRSLINEFDQVKSVQSQAGDLELKSAQLLMKLGDFYSASRRFKQFVSSYPNHTRVSDVENEEGMLKQCQDKISYYSIQ